MAKQKDQLWRDNTGDLTTWEELIDAYQATSRECAALHALLIKHKLPKRDVDNACYQARAEYFGWKKSSRYRPELVKNAVPKPATPAKKTTKKRAKK